MMPMVMTMGMISAARRLERLGNFPHSRSKPFQHGADNMIPQDENAVFLDLRAEVPIAQVPRELDQVQAIPALDLEELLFGRHDFDELAVIENQHIATCEKHRLLEIEHDHLAVFEMEQLAPQMPQVVRKNDFSDRVGRRRAGRQIGSNVLHDMSNSLDTTTMQNSPARCKGNEAGR